MSSDKQKSDSERFLFFAFRRGGSSISFSVVQHLFANSGLRAVDVAADFYKNGIDVPSLPATEIQKALATHHLVGCFRSVPDLSLIDWSVVRPILIVRDPRDCQLSWFHARHLHVNDPVPVWPVKGAFPHETLVEGEDFAGDMRSLHQFVKARNGLILRYEDLIVDPVGFLDRLIAYTGLPFSRSAYDTAVVEANFLQGVAHVDHHNRSGMPGEALRNLDPDARTLVNAHFGELALELGYTLEPAELPTKEVNRLKERDAIKRYLTLLATENALRHQDIERTNGELGRLAGLVARIHSSKEPGAEMSSARDVIHEDGRVEALQGDVASLKNELERVSRQNEMIIDICETLSQSVSDFGTMIDRLQREPFPVVGYRPK